jgi:hypothetical protein
MYCCFVAGLLADWFCAFICTKAYTDFEVCQQNDHESAAMLMAYMDRYTKGCVKLAMHSINRAIKRV